MSILLAQETVTRTQALGAFLIGLPLAALIGSLTGVFRPRSVLGPVRLEPQAPLLPLLLSSLFGAGVWLGTQIVYGAIQAAIFIRAHPGEPFSADHLMPADYAFLAVVPFALGVVCLLIGDASFDKRVRRAMGFHPRWLLRGVIRGLAGALIVFPIMFCGEIALTWLYQLTGFKHPAAHELLKALHNAKDPIIRWGLILGACLLAPLFEEYLFRGHLQTILVHLFTRRIITPRPPQAVASPPNPSAPAILSYPSAPEVSYRSRRWLAIVITSVVFALIHPLWMAPLIFVLSLCLGYAYERTGNLWTAITIHAAFNTANTIISLYRL